MAVRMAPMIAPPSGLDRVRWKLSARSPQPSTRPSTSAPRARACSRLSSTSAAAPSLITKPSRVFSKGRAARDGSSLRVDRAESREKRISASGCTVPSAPMHSAASASPRWIASTPSWIAEAPVAQAVVSEIGAPRVPKRAASRSPTPAKRKVSKVLPAAAPAAAISAG